MVHGIDALSNILGNVVAIVAKWYRTDCAAPIDRPEHSAESDLFTEKSCQTLMYELFTRYLN